MKYIVVNDIQKIIGKNRRYLYMYLLLVIVYCVVQIINKVPITNNLIESAMGLKLSKESDLLAILLFILHVGLHMLLSIKNFLTDFENGYENIFLRITIKKWVIYKILSIVFMNIIILIITNASIFLLFLINGYIIKKIIPYCLAQLLIILMFNFIFILLYLLSEKKAPLLCIILLFTLFYNYCLDYNSITYYMPIFIFIVVISILSIYYVTRHNIIKFFEIDGG